MFSRRIEKHTFFEKDRTKKRRFREKYGRKPTRAEIKQLCRNEIDLSGTGIARPLEKMRNVSEILIVQKQGGRP